MACAAWTTCCFGRGDSAAAVGVTGQNFIYETPPTLSLEYIARRARTHTHLLCTHRLARLLLFSFVYISLLFGEHILTYIRHWPGNRLLFSANKLKQHRYTRRTCCFILLLERVLLLTQLHPLHNTRTPIYTPFLRYPDAVFPPLVEKLKVGSHFAPFVHILLVPTAQIFPADNRSGNEPAPAELRSTISSARIREYNFGGGAHSA